MHFDNGRFFDDDLKRPAMVFFRRLDLVFPVHGLLFRGRLREILLLLARPATDKVHFPVVRDIHLRCNFLPLFLQDVVVTFDEQVALAVLFAQLFKLLSIQAALFFQVLSGAVGPARRHFPQLALLGQLCFGVRQVLRGQLEQLVGEGNDPAPSRPKIDLIDTALLAN